jgi:hypothetical protein
LREGSRDELERFRVLKKKEEKLLEMMSDVEGTSKIFERIVTRLTDEYCDDMDALVRTLRGVLDDIKKGKVTKYSELKLQTRSIELATAMYKATEGLTVLGSKSDTAKSAKKEKFDILYAQIHEGTIHDKTARVNQTLVEDTLIERIMERAYVSVGQRIKSANRLLETMKKVITDQIINKEVFRKEAPIHDRIEAGFDDESMDTEGEGDL